MTQSNGKTMRGGAEDEAGLERAGSEAIVEAPAGLGVTDSMLNAAYVFEAQLAQMTAWKHQLSQQMELLRRDGVKLLERQKNLAVERQRLAAERETVSGDRVYVQKLHTQVEEQTKRLTAEGERIAKGLAELGALEAEKGKWEEELGRARLGAAAAIQEAELARQRKADFETAVAGAETRLAEVRGLEARRGDLELQVAAAEATLTRLRAEMEAVEGERRGLRLKEGELAERELAAAELEEVAAGARREGDAVRQVEAERMERERKEIETGQGEIVRAREGLAEQLRGVEAARMEAEAMVRSVGEGAERGRVEAQEKMAEARGALEEISAARSRQDERWTALEARAGELAAAEEAVGTAARELAEGEEKLKAAKLQGEEAQGRLLRQQEALLAAERSVSEKIAAAEGELAAKLAAAETTKRQAEAERDGLSKQRQEIEKKLDLMEGELAEQFEAVAKQTKRLTERRADVEARSADVEKEIEARIARATEVLQEELGRARKTYEERVMAFKEQVERTEEAAAGWKAREAELERAAGAAAEEAAGSKRELARVHEELNEACQGRMEQTEILAQQVMRFEQESTDWERKLERARVEAGDSEGLKQAGKAADAARGEVEALTAQLEEIGAAREDAESRLSVQAARGAELEKLAEGLVAKLGSAEREMGELRGKAVAATRLAEEAARARQGGAASGEADAELKGEVERLKKQVEMLERQREDLVGQLFGVQDELRRRAEEGLLARNVMEGELVALRARHGAQEGAQRVNGETGKGLGDGKLAGQRGRLLRQARALRAYRQQVAETKGALAKGGEEMARQREQLRSRKENLEQVKRLLEKQEMVMARKLADHNALKTVAAVGIFLIMILGSVFFGVYKFVNPLYRSEAVVQLAAPEGMKGIELQAWLARQMEFVRSPEVTFAAWKILRSEGERYGMHDVREEWAASLGQRLSMQMDGETRTLSIRYVGSNPEGVSQVCNALAAAYVTPAAREEGDAKGVGAGAAILAKATVPLSASQDNRLMMSLAVAAVALFVSLLLVMVFRHYVARQLREIDRMADEQDLAELKGEMG